jgi:hypothetical protein
MFSFSFQAIAGYDDGLDHRQPRDLKIPSYTKEVKSNLNFQDIKVCFSLQKTSRRQSWAKS